MFKITPCKLYFIEMVLNVSYIPEISLCSVMLFNVSLQNKRITINFPKQVEVLQLIQPLKICHFIRN
jgi:hypothetical protein